MLLLVGISLRAWFAGRFVRILQMNVSGGSIGPCFPGACADDDPKSIVFFWMSVWIDLECEIWIGAFCWFKSMAPKLKRPCAALKKPHVT